LDSSPLFFADSRRSAAVPAARSQAQAFRFEEIPDAHRLMDSNQANGKIVVAH
jgi:hypothetical protein